MNRDRTFEPVFINDLGQFRATCDSVVSCPSDRWVYRGQADANWSLQTSIERAMSQQRGIFNISRMRAESVMLREFKRHAHRHMATPPSEVDRLEWLSLMQHHGAPTRLLDFTFSPYVALFFAVRHAVPGQRVAVYAINQTECWMRFKSLLPYEQRNVLERERYGEANDKDPFVVRWVLTELRTAVVCPLNPFRQNERLAIQQGTFLVPLDTEASFEDNLRASVGIACTRKIVIDCTPQFLREAWSELKRVNLTDHTLFPGLDGLARSLDLMMILPQLQPQV